MKGPVSGGGELRRFIVVDDDPFVRDMFVEWLLLFDPEADVVGACDGMEAIALFERCAFDLVVTDLNMPKANGFEVAQHVRQHDPESPIILVSGTWTPEEEQRARSLALNAVLEKPVEVDVFLAELNRILAEKTLC